jgi:DNA (cytosine-5)-methyltransferase 1
VQQQPTLSWNSARGVWEKVGMVNLLCEHWELFSETWPTLGMMRNGQVFELPMQAHRTTDSEFSSLPTPRAQEPGSTSAGYGDSLNDFASRVTKGYAPKDLVSLPTPAARDYKDGTAERERDGIIQTDTVARAIFNSGEVLLPTTRTSMANGASKSELEAGNPKGRLETVTNWGKFEPAIRRWEEVLGRPAPAPTKPDGKDGAHRLSSVFTEWMMGVPEGWITDCGLSRNDELKACGNGVVPQQAELALRLLLQADTIETGRLR